MKHLIKYGNNAAILGAAEGLGKAFSEELAKIGFDLLLFDKNKDLLCETATELELKYKINTQLCNIDLSNVGSYQHVSQMLTDQKVGIVIFNAAYGPVRPFMSNTLEDLDRYINLNCKSALMIIHQLLAKNNEKSSIGIILMSSLSALYGTKWIAPYAASKSFLQNLAESLHYEYLDQDIDFLSCCAGMIDTPGFQSSQPNYNTAILSPQSAKSVAVEALNALGKKPIHITGGINRLSYFALRRLLPRKWAARIVNRAMTNIYSRIHQ